MQEKRQNIAPIKERILQYIECQGIKKSSFLNEVGIALSNFKASGLKSEIGGDKIANILSIHPNLNAHWLLTGKGEMLLKGGENPVSSIGKIEECEKCKAFEKEVDLLRVVIEAKDETIRAYKDNIDSKDENRHSA